MVIVPRVVITREWVWSLFHLLLLQGNRYGHCSTCYYYKGIGMVTVPLVVITRE